MSFSSDVKDEIAHVVPDDARCGKATLAALVRIEGSLFITGAGSYRVEITTDVASVGRLVIRLLHSLYNLATDLTVRRSVLHKTPNYLITVPNQPGLRDALIDLGVLSPDGGFETGIKPELVDRPGCIAAYLRGAFLGSGFISNPKSDFHFEITTESEDLAEGLVKLMAEKGITARIMQRRHTYMVYLKSGNAITGFLAFVGAHQAALLLEQERVVKSVRNDVNRLTNAEMANQNKAAYAAVDQMMAIKTVLAEYSLESLPPAIRQFIRLRMAHPDATLKELGEYADPPLSKSAINHRVRRLAELAREIEEE